MKNKIYKNNIDQRWGRNPKKTIDRDIIINRVDIDKKETINKKEIIYKDGLSAKDVFFVIKEKTKKLKI